MSVCLQQRPPREPLGRHVILARDSLSECYFASKGAAVVLPTGNVDSNGTPGGCCSPGATSRSRKTISGSSDIQKHLQSMFYLLRPEETLKMAVKLESVHPQRTRYLVVVSRATCSDAEEACLLGIDCNQKTTVGLVLRVLADTQITLDGDGGFSVSVCSRQHIFKPVSVQAMWSALQTLHRVSYRAREQNYFLSGNSHDWVSYYEQRIESERSCLNEWHAMDCIESRRPPSPDSVRTKPRERDETERVIRSTLKEIMMSVDLDEVTSKVIRGRLEEDLDMDLGEFKSFIDHEMLTILGQMDAPTEIFDHVYLGSEWNASNLEELQKNGVRHILNVTREIDNFFPGMFDYLNIRVYDDEKTDLLKHWDNTFKYISRAKKEGSKVLVHCKMGVSRSASVVIAYAMKAFDWNFDKAMQHVKEKRTCIKPNTSFLSQLETYQGILDAMKNKEKLQRSKSETNLKSPGLVSKTDSRIMEPTPLIQALSGRCRGRPRSWSPDTRLASQLLPPTSLSLENLVPETKHVLMPCANGNYSVSQNQIKHLRGEGIPSVKHIVNELESHAAAEKKLQRERKMLKLNLANNLDSSKSSSEIIGDSQDGEKSSHSQKANFEFDSMSNVDITNNVPSSKECVKKTETWDPGENAKDSDYSDRDVYESTKCDSNVADVRAKPRLSGDLFSKQLDKVFDKEERRQSCETSDGSGAPPSRQSSFSSCDSAVIVDRISRNSSWGSYDTKPSRNSSWSSYDEAWNLGTVKRTKQKLEEGATKRICPDFEMVNCNNSVSDTVNAHKPSAVCDLDIIKENHEQSVKPKKSINGMNVVSDEKKEKSRAIMNELDISNVTNCNKRKSRSSFLRLSASAPAACVSFLDRHPLSPSSNSVGNLYSAKCMETDDSSLNAKNVKLRKPKTGDFKMENSIIINKTISGKVKNLKMEFEAKSNSDTVNQNSANVGNNGKGRSLPSSPVSVHIDKQKPPESETATNPSVQTTSLEDLSVKVLVDKYDRPKSQQFSSKINPLDSSVPLRKSSFNRDNDNKTQRRGSPAARNSFCGTIRAPSTSLRPPVPTVVAMPSIRFSAEVVASVVAKAQTKKQMQHGKTHPLSRLKNHTPNRCTNPVYNTM